MDPAKHKQNIQTARDYEMPKAPSKELVQLHPSTPTKTPAQRPTGQFPPLTSNYNRYSPLQNLPELPYKSVLATPSKQIQTSQAPQNNDEFKYVSKPWTENIGFAPFTEIPQSVKKQDYIRRLFPSSQYWETDNPEKIQKFYEFILVNR
ncbi:hypothetical protein F511_04969 [Dorcoceras hygrometricum]|uniref:Uncharacterized protein n=1 Tax=Dorcoceras hygrometricum TaxID=472368 RepID=A0A2Z7CYN1_9LAMI|nr:hypothetical protein F511_04969 [Dorcoceras hygrometricum]